MKYFHLALSLAVVSAGAITDIRQGVVRNKHLLIAFSVWAVSVVLYMLIAPGELSFPFLYYCINLVLAAALSIIFYYMDIWAPGDVKLYLLIAIIYPFSCYSCKPGNLFPALDLAIFAFAFGYLCLLVSSFVRKQKGQMEPSSFFRWFSKNRLFLFAANIGLFSFIPFVFRLFLPDFYNANRSLCILLTAGIVYLADRKIPTIKMVIGYLLFAIFLVLSFIDGDLYRFLFHTGESILLAAAFGEIGRIMESCSYSEVPGEDVRPGMILSFRTIWDMQKCIDPNIPKTTTESRRSRITAQQAEAVRNWSRITKRSITIVDMLPFVPMLAFGLAAQILRYFLMAY